MALDIHAKVDATDYGDVGGGNTGQDHIREVWFGPAFGGIGPNHFDIRSIKIGSGGYGSSDVWAPTLTGMGDFDAFYGSGADPTFSAGVMAFNNSGDRYGVHDLGADYTEIYVQFELRVYADNNGPDYHDIAIAGGGASGHATDGLFDDSGQWWFDGVGTAFGSGPARDGTTWQTINLHWAYPSPPPLGITKAVQVTPHARLARFVLVVHNPTVGALTVTQIQDVLPAGFVYVPGTSYDASSASISDPAITGGGLTLTWTGPFALAAGGTVEVHFSAQIVSFPTADAAKTNNASAVVDGTTFTGSTGFTLPGMPCGLLEVPLPSHFAGFSPFESAGDDYTPALYNKFAASHTDIWARVTYRLDVLEGFSGTYHAQEALFVLGWTEWVNDQAYFGDWWRTGGIALLTAGTGTQQAFGEPWNVSTSLDTTNYVDPTVDAEGGTGGVVVYDLHVQFLNDVTISGILYSRWLAEVYENNVLKSSYIWRPNGDAHQRTFHSMQALTIFNRYGGPRGIWLDDISVGTSQGASDVLAVQDFNDGGFGDFTLDLGDESASVDSFLVTSSCGGLHIWQTF